MSVLVCAEARRGTLRDTAFELVSAAASLGGPINVLLIGADPAPLNVPGVETILHAEREHFEPHVHAAAVKAAIERFQPGWILAPHSIDAMGYAPAVAAELGLGFASDVHSLDPLVRGASGGKLVAALELPAAGATHAAARRVPDRGAGRRRRDGRAARARRVRRGGRAPRLPRARGRGGHHRRIVPTRARRRRHGPGGPGRASKRSRNDSTRRSPSRARSSTPSWSRSPARSASRARSSSPRSTSRSGSPAPSSTWPACAARTRSSPSTPTPRRRSSSSPTTVRSPTSSKWRAPSLATGRELGRLGDARARPARGDPLAQHELLDLRPRHRPLVDEAHVARDLVGRDLADAEVDQLLLVDRRAGLELRRTPPAPRRSARRARRRPGRC